MRPRIAIPMPHSSDRAYAERAIPQYERAVELTGGEPVRIPLNETPAEIRKIIEHCDAVLLPGSKADVEPAKFKAPRSPHSAPADSGREAVDELLLEDAYRLRKPILGICYGLQSLNVYRGGSLIQHIPDFLPENLRAPVDHEAGKKVAVAHEVEIEADSLLAGVLCSDSRPQPALSERSAPKGLPVLSEAEGSGRAQLGGKRSGSPNSIADREGYGFSRAHEGAGKMRPSAPEANAVIPVNSSHHQSADAIGAGLRVVARCPADDIIEALEGTSPDHFVLAVQWHPERSVDDDESSRAIFRALVQKASNRCQK